MGGNFAFGLTPGNEIAFPGTFNSGTGIFNFNGSGAQSITGPNSPTFNNLVVNKTQRHADSRGELAGEEQPHRQLGRVRPRCVHRQPDRGGRNADGQQRSDAEDRGNEQPAHELRDSRPRPDQHGRVHRIGRADDHGDELRQLDEQLDGGADAAVGPDGRRRRRRSRPARTRTRSRAAPSNFNGAGAQTIPAFGYNNLTSSSTGARTLASSGTSASPGRSRPARTPTRSPAAP